MDLNKILLLHFFFQLKCRTSLSDYYALQQIFKSRINDQKLSHYITEMY